MKRGKKAGNTNSFNSTAAFSFASWIEANLPTRALGPGHPNHIIQHLYIHTCRYDQETRMPGRGFGNSKSKPDYRQSNGRDACRDTRRGACAIFCACGPKARAGFCKNSCGYLFLPLFVDCLPFLACPCLKDTHFGLLSSHTLHTR